MFKVLILFVTNLSVCELRVFILSKLHNQFPPVGILTFPGYKLKNKKLQTCQFPSSMQKTQFLSSIGITITAFSLDCPKATDVGILGSPTL